MNYSTCKGCKWYYEYEGVCTNADSPYVADFVDYGCTRKEED